jgi:hypothetical protein
MANESFSKIQNAVTRTTAAIGVKTSVFVESAKIKTHIGTIKKEIGTMISDLGSIVYEAWEKDEIDTAQIAEQCEQIKAKYESIDELNQEIEKLEKQEGEVLGVKKPDSGGAAMEETPASYICPNCRLVYEAPVKFCRKCGTKMV